MKKYTYKHVFNFSLFGTVIYSFCLHVRLMSTCNQSYFILACTISIELLVEKSLIIDSFVMDKIHYIPSLVSWGWSGGAMGLGKLSVPGRPTDLDNGKARA